MYTIEKRCACAGDVKINRDEAMSYLGYQKNAKNKTLNDLFNDAEAELREKIDYRACYVKLPCKINDNELDLGILKLKSRDLSKFLAGHNEVYLFAATLGIAVDRLTSAVLKTSSAKATVIDALASAAIESWCDKLESDILSKPNSLLRFSPGYGDLPLDMQKDILSILDASHMIGVSLTESLMLTPKKSVTAFFAK